MDIYSEIVSLSKRRGFFYPAFDIYGGEAGFYDYGPLGTRLKHNVEDKWRSFYVLRERCMEISTPAITPYAVFKASGHVDKFLDVVLTCPECGFSAKEEAVEEPYRSSLECPECGGTLKRGDMNLMFETETGALDRRPAFLRPETAQGIFVDFPFLYQFSRKKLPMGVVQVGPGFRNEVSPRQSLYRLREFSMAEAEIFFDPEDKTHPRFDDVADDVLTVIPAGDGERQATVRALLDEDVIGNQALAYYVALTRRFLLAVGIDEEKLRFRQHEPDEMAHYASDCWDAEILTALGWIECVGIADRTAYDLGAHMEATAEDMTAFRRYDEPHEETRRRIVPDMAKLGPAFKGTAKDIADRLGALDPGDDVDGGVTVTVDGEDIDIDEGFYDVVEETVTVSGESFIPHVVEPSYGVDRIIYSILEHSYARHEKEGESYVRLQLPSDIAPIAAGVFPLVSKEGLPDIARDIADELRSQGLLTYYDEGGSIGRRYARMDEIGTPFCITVDFDTLKDDTVTVRYRDTTEQVRVARDELAGWVRERIER